MNTTGLPIAPWSIFAFAATYPTSNRRISPSWKKTPLVSTARFNAMAPSSEMDGGFSQKMGLPSAAHSAVCGACMCVGLTITNASTDVSLSSPPTSV